MATDIRRVGVIGAGTMGSGIAQLLAQNGISVRLSDLSEEILTHAEGRILSGLQKVGKPEALAQVVKTTRFEDLEDCDLVIEAAVEAFGIKQDIFKNLDKLLDPKKIIATNTSSLSIGNITTGIKNPERVVGLHFFNPAPVMKLVEVVPSSKTSQDTVRRALDFTRILGKSPILCKDTPGFVVNRVARPFYVSSLRLLERGAGTPADIDAAVRNQGGLKMGPFELMDLIGLDTNLAITRVIYEALGCPEHLKPSDIQTLLVLKHCLGRKTSRGFYLYSDEQPPIVNPLLRELVPMLGSGPMSPETIFSEILDSVVAEARQAAKDKVATEEDIDTAIRLGLNWPKGPLAWKEELSQQS